MRKFRNLRATPTNEEEPVVTVYSFTGNQWIATVTTLDEGGEAGGSYARLFVEAPAMLRVLRRMQRDNDYNGVVNENDYKRALAIIARIDGVKT